MASEPSTLTGKIARSAGAVSAAVMCSRVLGLIREQVFAGLFGAGYAYDAFVVAFRIPNLLRDLFGEGALSAAFVTVFSDYETNRGDKATWQLANTVLVFFLLLLSLFTLAGIYLADPIVRLMTVSDYQDIPGKVDLTVQLTRIMFPFLVFISLAAVVMGILNTKGRFFVPAMASSFFNLGSIVGGVSLALLFPKIGQPAIAGMAWGTLIGGMLQLLIQVPALFRAGYTFRFSLNFRDPGLRRILLLMLPATIGVSATQINIFVNTIFASSLVQGSLSWLNYAFRLVQLPIGVFGVAFAIAVMPVLGKHAARKDLPELTRAFNSSLVMVLSLTIPATAGLILLAEPIIRLIFEHGAFTPLDTLRTAEALTYYAIGLFAYSGVKVMVPVFYALGNTRYPVVGSFIAVAANIVLISLTIDLFQHKAIALSTSCTMTLNFLFLGAVLCRKLPDYSLMPLLKGCGKILGASLVMAACVWSSRGFLISWLQGSIPQQLAGVFLLIFLGVLVYYGVLAALRLPELAFITGRIRQRLGGNS
jgi:putative peptidoglycan lipid II flippase